MVPHLAIDEKAIRARVRRKLPELPKAPKKIKVKLESTAEARPMRGPHIKLCTAPVDASGEKLCNDTATTTRIAAGLTCPLCAKHAIEFDADI